MSLKSNLNDDVYSDPSKNVYRNKVALNLASSEPHTNKTASVIDELAARNIPESSIRKLLGDLSSGRPQSTYGTFCELSAYSFLLKGNHQFNIQVGVTGSEILNPNGSDLDGCIKLVGDIFFDAKGFGFHGYMINLLLERLAADFEPELVTAEGSWDVSMSLLSALLENDYQALKSELQSKRMAQRGALTLMLKSPAPVLISSRGCYVL